MACLLVASHLVTRLRRSEIAMFCWIVLSLQLGDVLIHFVVLSVMPITRLKVMNLFTYLNEIRLSCDHNL